MNRICRQLQAIMVGCRGIRAIARWLSRARCRGRIDVRSGRVHPELKSDGTRVAITSRFPSFFLLTAGQVAFMRPDEFIGIARNILDSASTVRERAIDEAVDSVRSYSPAQASALATLLSAIAVSERQESCLEAELHAIFELMSTGHVTRDHVSHLQEIRNLKSFGGIREYISDLLEA